MMKKLKQFLENFALDYVIKYLQNNKADVIKTANSKLDLPILNEKQEKELLEAIYEVILTIVSGIKK